MVVEVRGNDVSASNAVEVSGGGLAVSRPPSPSMFTTCDAEYFECFAFL